MKAETYIFGICSVFFVLVAPAYWFITGDPTGTAALTMTFLLALLVTFYLYVAGKKVGLRPEDRQDAEIADGAGELGFFPPYSWWPLWCGLTLAVIVFSVALSAWWLLIMGFGFGAITVCGWIYEYYRGVHAH